MDDESDRVIIISPRGLSISFSSSHLQSTSPQQRAAASILVSLLSTTAGLSSSSSCPSEYSDDNIIIDGDGLSRLPPPPLPPSPAVSSQCRSNTEQEEEECHRRSNDDIINREEGTDEGGSVGGDAEAVAAIVATVSNYYASNEIGMPSNDDVRDIVPTAAVSARRPWKEQTAFSDCDARNAEGQSALSISSSNCFLGGMKLLIDSSADVNLRDVYMRTPLHCLRVHRHPSSSS